MIEFLKIKDEDYLKVEEEADKHFDILLLNIPDIEGSSTGNTEPKRSIDA